MKNGESQTISVRVHNSSDQAWYAHKPGQEPFPVNLGYRWLDADRNPLALEGRATLTQPLLLPQVVDQLKLEITAPATPGSYVLLLSMVQDGVAWFQDRGAEPLLLPATVV